MEGRVYTGTDPDYEPMPTAPAPSASDRYGVFAFGTNDYRNPDAAVAAARDVYANASSMGMTPVFVLPNPNDKRFAPVSQALQSFAEERGIKYEVPQYDPKDPLHVTRQSAIDIAKRYPDAFIGGDSNSVRIANWGYGQKLRDPNTFVDPRTGLIMGRVGAPSADLAKWITQYRKSLESGRFAGGRTGYQSRGRVIPEMENPSEALEPGGMRPVGPTLGEAYGMPAVRDEVPRPMVGAATKPQEKATNAGFTKEVFHATRATEPFEEFRMSRGPQRHDLLGVHVGSLQAAEDRLRKYFGKDYGMKSGVANEGQAPSIMPLMARMESPFSKKSGEPYTEAELRRQVTTFAQKNNLKPDSINAKIAFEKHLAGKGYDHIPYVNSVEDRGNVSYLILQPQNLRSRWAEFDPTKSQESGLGKTDGGSVVDQALMVLSKKANRRRGRPE